MKFSAPVAFSGVITLAAGIFFLISVACTSSEEASSSWSRTYLAPRDKVIDTVVDVLEDEHYLVEADRQSGKIEALPSREQTGRRAHLVVRIEERKDGVRVDVQTRSQMEVDLRARQLDEGPVLEFFHELDLRMQGIHP